MDSCVETFLGLPYRSDNEPDGLNCWDLVRKVFWVAKQIALPDPNLDWEEVCNSNESLEAYGGDDWVEVAPPYQEYDVLLFRKEGVDAGVHAGLWVGGGQVLHATKSHGVITRALRLMKHKLYGAYRHRCLV